VSLEGILHSKQYFELQNVVIHWGNMPHL
jgi:hypothetical protein